MNASRLPRLAIASSLAVLAVLAGACDRRGPSASGALVTEGGPLPPATDATRAALGGLGPGSAIGPFVIETISEPTGGAIVIETDKSVTFEVRRAADQALRAPATAGEYAVYYRTPAGPVEVPGEQLGAGAEAIASAIAKAAPGTAMPSGLTPLMPRPAPP